MSLVDKKCKCDLKYRDIPIPYIYDVFTYLKITYTDYVKNKCTLCGQGYITKENLLKGLL